MRQEITRRKFIQYALLGMGGLASYSVLVERYAFQINTYHIPIPNLPQEFFGYTIVQLTDLHYGFLMSLDIIAQIVLKINSLPRDMIVCTGDYIHERNSLDQIDEVWPYLMQLNAPDGVYSILGNHDHWADTKRSLYWLERSGHNIRYTAKDIVRDKKRIWIGGAGDYWEDYLGIDETFEEVPPQDCKILLAHNPDTADTDFKTRIDLMISGHTHGGQVNIPFVGSPVLPVDNKLYSSGLIQTEKTRLYISRGLGWTGVPIRFNCFPEISVLKLIRA